MHKLIIILLVAFLFTGCKKSTENSTCTSLKEGITANNVQQVGDVITNYINSLPSADYTDANINRLVQKIAGDCNFTSGAYCFECIKTLPSQTEIWIEVSNGGPRKIIDISYNTTTNKMKFVNMHD